MAATTSIASRHRWTVAELHRFIQCGAFTPEDRLELIEGDLIDMAPIGPEHAGCVDQLNRQFNQQTPSDCWVRIQNPVTLSDASEPQPNIVIARALTEPYTKRHPSAEDVLLLVEVADTTGGYDRGVKLPFYAASGIKEFWLIDLQRREIEVYRDPKGNRYGSVTTYCEGEIKPYLVPGVVVSVTALLA